MSLRLNELKVAIGAGARANKYRVNLSMPAIVPNSALWNDADVLCETASFPGVTVAPIELWTQGRKLLIPGDTEYDNTWELNFYQTVDHALRRDMIAWMTAADNFQANLHSGMPISVLGELSVEQLGAAGEATAKYTFHNVFVTSVGAVDVGDASANEIQKFSVTFSFTDWVVGDNALSIPSAVGAVASAVSALL